MSDKFPVSPGHMLMIPRRQLMRFRELTAVEKSRLLEWVDWAQPRSPQTLTSGPEVVSLGVNDGKVAEQALQKFHFHVIPRHAGDTIDPSGDVR
jgi:diadenosine tetraphosphate (Ap4A) HIT family hydrolase